MLRACVSCRTLTARSSAWGAAWLCLPAPPPSLPAACHPSTRAIPRAAAAAGYTIARRHVFTPAIHAQLDALVARHAALSSDLAEGRVDAKRLPAVSREQQMLENTVAVIREYKDMVAELDDLRAVMAEAARGSGADAQELLKMARGEAAELEVGMEEAEQRLKRLLLPTDEADLRDCIVEVRAGTGGDEAGLFAGEMMAMYQHYAAKRGWTCNVLSVSSPDVGGVKEAALAVQGMGAFGRLKYESGVHRVQRIPVTEAGGRVHTSTMSVAVLPEAEEVDVDIRPADLRIDTYRAQGAGGQHVNTTDSAVRITHMPTGIVVACQDERSQHQNRAKAMRVLRARVFEAERQRLADERAAARRSQIGRAERSERVRTYNFTQDRVTDHRVNLTKFGVEAMLQSDFLDEFIDALHDADEAEQLESLETDANTGAKA